MSRVSRSRRPKGGRRRPHKAEKCTELSLRPKTSWIGRVILNESLRNRMQDARMTHRAPRDPAESWEIHSAESEGGSYGGICDIFPFTPRRAEDIAEGALESLNE